MSHLFPSFVTFNCIFCNLAEIHERGHCKCKITPFWLSGIEKISGVINGLIGGGEGNNC